MGLGTGSLLAPVHFGRVSDGSASGPELFGPGRQWLEVRTALTRGCSRSQRVPKLNSQGGKLQLTSTTFVANPGHLQSSLEGRKIRAMPKPLLGPWSVPNKNVFVTCLNAV